MVEKQQYERLTEKLPLRIDSKAALHRCKEICFEKPSIFQDAVFQSYLKIGSLILAWYILSTGLSMYNKFFVGKEHGLFGHGGFPAPLFMASIQFFFQYLFARIVFGLGIIKRTQAAPMNWRDYAKLVIPNGITTGLDIGFSNKSLAYITMSFYTMCKSTAPIFLLLFSFIMRIEKPSWRLTGVVGIIACGLFLLVRGEAQFDPLGFALVMTASCLSGLRFTLTQLLLHGSEGKVSLGSPLEVVELLTPIMSLTTLFLSMCWEHIFTVLPFSPYFSSLGHMLATVAAIAVGGVVAFCMVWVEYQVIAETSALTFIVAGTMKEVITVLAAVVIMGDRLGATNGIGLGVVILGVLLFNIYKHTKITHGEIPVHRRLPDRDADRSMARPADSSDCPLVEVEMGASSSVEIVHASAHTTSASTSLLGATMSPRHREPDTLTHK